jgi:release factor glutamine methyltransferase
MIIENTIKNASDVLKKNLISSHLLDAEILLAEIMRVPREFLILKKNLYISDQILKKYNFSINRRLKREPVAYITGKKEFWSVDFLVNKSTLVPRPETELLVFEVLKFFKNKKINLLDIGTGSGCILLSILKELNTSQGLGIDVSKAAIQTARLNAQKLKLTNRANFIARNISHLYNGKYDLIVSNPPYIPIKDLKNLSREILNYEPLIALNGGVNGLDLIKKIIYKSKKLLKKSGILAIEIGNQQYLKVRHLLRENGLREISKVYDFRRNVRCILSTK